jgi:hypothetical protein
VYNKAVLTKISNIFTIVYVGFISIFALDVFSEGYGLSELLVAFFMHLLPSIIILLTYFLLRKQLLLRTAAFIGLALVSVFFFRALSNPITLIIITLPLGTVAWLSYSLYKHTR